MAKKRIDLIMCKGTIINLQTFKEIEEVNKTVRKYKEEIDEMKLRKDVKANLISILEYLKRHSIKYPGVSFKGKRKIAAELELTDKTVTRICARLEKFGYIKQYEMKRHSDMRQTCNAIVIQPVMIESVRQASEEVSDQKDNISLKPLRNNNRLNVKRSPYVKYVPQSLQHYGAIFGANLRDLYGRVWLAAKKLGIIADQPAMQQVGFTALERLKQYVKQGEQLSEDQQRKLAYKIAYNQLQQGVENGDIFDISDMYAVVKQANK